MLLLIGSRLRTWKLSFSLFSYLCFSIVPQSNWEKIRIHSVRSNAKEKAWYSTVISPSLGEIAKLCYLYKGNGSFLLEYFAFYRVPNVSPCLRNHRGLSWKCWVAEKIMAMFEPCRYILKHFHYDKIYFFNQFCFVFFFKHIEHCFRVVNLMKHTVWSAL